jgi:hypothetical protein
VTAAPATLLLHFGAQILIVTPASGPKS